MPRFPGPASLAKLCRVPDPASVTPVGDVHRHAVTILESAQAMADRLTAQARAEAAEQASKLDAMRAEYAALRHESDLDRSQAERDRAEAQSLLTSAREEAQQLLADATAQAADVSVQQNGPRPRRSRTARSEPRR